MSANWGLLVFLVIAADLAGVMPNQMVDVLAVVLVAAAAACIAMVVFLVHRVCDVVQIGTGDSPIVPEEAVTPVIDAPEWSR